MSFLLCVIVTWQFWPWCHPGELPIEKKSQWQWGRRWTWKKLRCWNILREYDCLHLRAVCRYGVLPTCHFFPLIYRCKLYLSTFVLIKIEWISPKFLQLKHICSSVLAFCSGNIGSPGYHGDVPPSYYDNEEFTNSGFEDKTIRQAFIRKVCCLHCRAAHWCKICHKCNICIKLVIWWLSL